MLSARGNNSCPKLNILTRLGIRGWIAEKSIRTIILLYPPSRFETIH